MPKKMMTMRQGHYRIGSSELTAHRTLALRDALAENPNIALQAVLHNLVLTAFYWLASSGSCLEIGLHHADVSRASSRTPGEHVSEGRRGAA